MLAHILKRSADEILGSTDAELLAPACAEMMISADRRVFATGTPETGDEPVVVDGEVRILAMTRSPYRARDGTIVGVITVARDITDRLRDAERLKQSEQLLRLVIDALPVGVLVVDPAGDIVLGNPAAERIWGQSIPRGLERWVRSRGWWHDSGVPVRPHDWASVRALVEGVPQVDQLIDIEGFDGTRRTIRNSSVPFVQPTGIQGAVILNEDVTERLRLESRLAQAQKMEAVGQLAGGVAHDFNNLLMVIMSYAALLGESLEDVDPRRADVDEIRKAADSAAALTRQLLAFGRRDVAQPRPVHLEAVVSAVEQRLARVIGDDIRLISRLAEPGNIVWIDPVHLDQIVMNLAVNARDAMPAGGELTLATRTTTRSDDEARALGLARGGDFVILAVSDTGTGMDERTRARIFEPFFTTKERDRGTGLGLATVFAIVAASGGAIRVATEPGRGTTFEIELPLTGVAGQAGLPQAETSEPRGHEQILLVDDTVSVRAAVRAMLERLGYVVHDVGDAAAALDHLRGETHFDLLLTDVALSGVNGRELAQAVVLLRPHIRVLYMSAHPDDDVLRQGPLAGSSRILGKPFPADVLARAVRDALDG
jgi:two-component system cell cycle sensor histidine kinase/response regulator CckA